MRRSPRLILVLAAILLPPHAAPAQTRTRIYMPWRQTGVGPYGPPPPLGSFIEDSEDIVVLQVGDVDSRQGVITYKATAALKGKRPAEAVRHRLGDDFSEGDRAQFLEWARPGKTAVWFRQELRSVVCVGNAWYAVKDNVTASEPRENFTTTYVGPTDRLREHIGVILAGKEVTLTATVTDDCDPVPRGPMSREWVRGQKGRVWQLRASAKITFRDREVPLDESEEFLARGGDKAAVPNLVRALTNADALIRCEAAEDLGQVGPPARDALPALRTALRDSDARVRVYAALALAHIDGEDRQAIPALLAALKEDEPARITAIAALAELAPRSGAAVPALLTALSRDADVDARAGAAFALGRIAREATDLGRSRGEVITALTRAVQDDKAKGVRGWAIEALGRFGPDAKSAIDALKGRIKGRTNESHLAAEALRRIGPAAVPALCEAMKAAEGKFRPDLIGYLEEMGPAAKTAVPDLRELLKADSLRDRNAAVAALMRIAWKSEARTITEALREQIERGWLGGDAYYRLQDYVGELGPGDEAILPALIASLKHGEFKDAAPSVIARMGPTAREAIPALLARVSDTTGADPEIAYALWRLGHRREAVTALRKRWETENEVVHKPAILFVLADVGPDAAELAPLLTKALRQKPENFRERYVQACVALALWRVQTPVAAGGFVADPRQEALDLLLRLLRDNHIEAIQALGLIGPEAKAALPGLIKAARHEWWDTRLYAVRALGRVGAGDSDAIEALTAALKDRNSRVRAEAAAALVRIGKPTAGLPVLIDVLRRRPSVLTELADTLIDLGSAARPFVPALSKALLDDDRTVRYCAARVLRSIDPKAAAKAGVP